LIDCTCSFQRIIPLDTRKSFAFEVERIPTAINIPHREMNTETTAHLDRDALYVVYCDGIGCNASTKGALNMTRLGFKVKELIGGIEWWKFDKYDTEGTHAWRGGLKVECAC
jgi:rhodanese-related sulfurtransferase